MTARHRDELKRKIATAVDELAPTLLELSHRIHATPELAFHEHHAATWLAQAGERAGLDVERPAFGLETAFVAEFGTSAGPAVALVSKYDALPDIGHGCGHNIIAAVGLGAALALHRLDDRLPGTVRYLGTPGEERGCGKELLARAGAWDGIDAAMMLHPANTNLKAVRTQCLAEAEVTFIGRAAHAALAPQAARSALDALVLAYQAVAQLRQHLAGSERITGVLTEGGSAPNVVPETASARYFAREFTASAVSPEGDQAVIDGAKTLAMTAIDFLTDAGLRRQMDQAFAASSGSDEAPAPAPG
ncbi:amidohydrolase [Nonomuraea sp. NPDC049695]|uniref:amidohydrolase n=1 Tax=Nonomuraea sp. NPDC049695 TaxID=3154734 RepID=UPI00342ED912